MRHRSPRWALPLIVLLTALLAAAGCSSADSSDAAGRKGPSTAVLPNLDPVPIASNPQSRTPTTVKGFDGTEVTIADTSRIVAVDRYGTLAQTVYALGLGDRLVGRNTAAAFPAVAKVPDVSPGGNSLNTEAILALRPTVVLTDTSIGPQAVQDQLRTAGIPVVFFDPGRTMNSVGPQIQAVADALGVPEQGKALADRTQREITDATAAMPHSEKPLRIAFLYLRSTALTLLAGRGSGADALIAALGAQDAGTESGVDKQFVPITSEAMIAAAPDVLLTMSNGLKSIGGEAGLEKIPGIAQTPAGRDHRVVDMQDSVLLSFGPNTGRVVKALGDAVYRS